jgi:hypothetical protein
MLADMSESIHAKRTGCRQRLVACTICACIGAPVPAPTANADILSFQSPSGNIGCALTLLSSTSPEKQGSSVQCDIGVRDWVLANCPQDRPASFMLGSGKGPTVECHNIGSLLAPGLPTLGYGQTRTAGVISCSSQSSGIRCTNTVTGQFFSVSRESFQTG